MLPALHVCLHRRSQSKLAIILGIAPYKTNIHKIENPNFLNNSFWHPQKNDE